jgi:hypothetical protein
MSDTALADCVLLLHAMFITVVVLGVPLIAIGGMRRWQWVGSPWFRFTHLGMIAFVAAESITGMTCPLTTWENNLRLGASQQGYGGEDFIAAWLTRLVFYHFQPWVFTCAYVGFALLVAGLFYFVPVRSTKSKRP